MTEGISYIEEISDEDYEMIDHYDAADAAGLIDRLGPAMAFDYIARFLDNPEYVVVLTELASEIPTRTFGEGVEI